MVLNYQQKGNFDFTHNSCQYFCFKLLQTYIQQKNQPPIWHIQVDRAIPVNQHARQNFYNNTKNISALYLNKMQ